MLGDQIRGRQLPIKVDDVLVALVPRGLAIMGGKPLPVAGILVATLVKTTLMVTLGRRRGGPWIAPILIALLAQQIGENSTWASCPSRFQQDCAILEEQASSYHGRNGPAPPQDYEQHRRRGRRAERPGLAAHARVRTANVPAGRSGNPSSCTTRRWLEPWRSASRK